MEFGFILPNNWGSDDISGVIELAVEAEQLGLSSVWVNHHVLNEGYIGDRLGDRPYYDALTTLAWVGARTERVLLGTSVLVMPYVHAMSVAKAFATIDQLSGGRVIAGLGVGSLPDENEQLGVLYDGRGQFGDEFIDVMRALWAPGAATFAGEHYSMVDAMASPKPRQDHLPIWIGGSGGPAQRRAAARGDGWHPLCSVDGLARRMPTMVERLSNEGRTRSDLVVAPRIDIGAVADADAVQAWTEAGADQLIVGASGHDLASHRAALHHVASLVS